MPAPDNDPSHLRSPYPDPTGQPVPKTDRSGYGILGSDSAKTGRVRVERGASDEEHDKSEWGPNDIGIDFGEEE